MDDTEAYLQRIGELVERAAYRQALKVCDQALVAHPDCAEAHDYRGLILTRMGRYGDALPAYDRAISIEPDFLPALLDKAELLVYYLGENEAAIPLTDRVIRLGGHEVDAAHAAYLKGIAYANLDLHEEAIADFDQAISLDPDYPDSYCERGASLFESYRFSEALRSLKTAVGMDPRYARPHHFLACLYEYLGEPDLAQRELALAAEMDPEAYPLPLALDEDDFARAQKEAVNTLPREVGRVLARHPLETQWLPDRALLADGSVKPSALAVLGAPDAAGSSPLMLFQRNLERTAHTRPELVEEIAHAISHELGHPERE